MEQGIAVEIPETRQMQFMDMSYEEAVHHQTKGKAVGAGCGGAAHARAHRPR